MTRQNWPGSMMLCAQTIMESRQIINRTHQSIYQLNNLFRDTMRIIEASLQWLDARDRTENGA